MSVKSKGITTTLILWAIQSLKKIKRGLFSFLLILKKLFLFFNQIIFKKLFLLLYKIHLLIKKGIYLIWGRFLYSSENKIFSALSHRQLIHLFIFLITFLIIIQNTQTEAEQDQPTIKSILNIVNTQEEEIIEEGLSMKQSDCFFQKTTLKTQPYLEKETKEETPLCTILGKTVLIKPVIPTTTQTPKLREKIEYYIVQAGDVIGAIAQKFSLKINTILWANNLSFYSIIKPGQNLVILPVDGLIHKVKKNETVEKIAKKYKVDSNEIIKVNKLTLTSQLEIGKDLIIPGAEKIISIFKKPRILEKILQPYLAKRTGGHQFPWGYCTWYVAQKRFIPWGGNAKDWITNARRYGYSIGNKPAVGAVIVTRESWWGHVAYVEVIDGKKVTFSEMNHLGRGVSSHRTLKTSDWRIIGYIY